MLSTRAEWLAAGALALALATAPERGAPATAAADGQAPARSAIAQEELSFPSRGLELHGTLYFPCDATHCPMLIVLHGASSASRTLPLYRHLAEMLPPLGMAVFVFDRRSGAGQHNFEVLAEDGIAARRAVAHAPPVDSARMGYWGVSQGGWLALLAAAQDPQAAFVIAVSAPLTTPDVQMNFAVGNILRIKGYSPADIHEALAAREAVDAFLRGTLDRQAAERALAAARQKPWFALIYLDDRLPADPASSAWLEQMRFDPVPILERVKLPTLLIYGQADPWVPVGDSLHTLAPIGQQHKNVQSAVVDGADHTMMLGVRPEDQIDPAFFAHEAPNAPAYFALLASWLTQKGLARSSAHWVGGAPSVPDP